MHSVAGKKQCNENRPGLCKSLCNVK